MTTRHIPPVPQPDIGTDPREVASRRRRDFLDFLVKSSSSAVALAAVGTGGGGVALDVAVLAAGHVFRRALRIAPTQADRIVIVAAHRHRRLVARGAGGESDGES